MDAMSHVVLWFVGIDAVLALGSCTGRRSRCRGSSSFPTVDAARSASRCSGRTAWRSSRASRSWAASSTCGWLPGFLLAWWLAAAVPLETTWVLLSYTLLGDLPLC